MSLNSIGINPFPKSHSNGRGRERVLFTLAGNEQRKVTKPQRCGRVEGGGIALPGYNLDLRHCLKIRVLRTWSPLQQQSEARALVS